jgi:hypothetical protein
MRENEEAQRLEDEAQAHHGDLKGGGDLAAGRVNGSADGGGGGSEMDIDDDTPQQQQQQQQPQKQAVLSH